VVLTQTAPDFLALRNVACVGDLWLTPKDAIAAGDWAKITALARAAAALRPRPNLHRTSMKKIVLLRQANRPGMRKTGSPDRRMST
jgi:hypothetical protein